MFLLKSKFWTVKNTPTKGRGIFAQTEISPGTVVGDYVGRVVHASEVKKSELPYELSCTEEFSILPDISSIGIHLINHSCAPNCEMFPFKGHLLYFTLRKIFAGEELTVSYHLGEPDYETDPCRDFCHCGTPVCRGTLHNSNSFCNRYDVFESIVDKEYHNKLPAAYGTIVPLLTDYPKIISDYPLYDLFGSWRELPLVCSESVMPTPSVVRSYIRKSGRQLMFPKLHISIYGIMNSLMVSSYI